jgi:hypothetical protein
MMNTQQPEALRLADYIEKDPRYYDASEWEKEAAAELRRQFDEIKRLHSVNAELFEVLQELLASERSNSFVIVGRDTDGHPLSAAGVARKKARTAIARAAGLNKAAGVKNEQE